MAFEVLDPSQFSEQGAIREESFLTRADQFDWESLREKKVLIRGCGDLIVPPWAFMYLTAKLCGIAHSVRYGNEHDNIVIYRKAKS